MPGTSTVLTPDQTLAALRKFGVQFNEIPGWQTRNRGDYGGGMPVAKGFVVHHTGDDAPDDADLRVVRDGRPDLGGPLSHFGLRDDGVVDVIAHGRCSHAGTGDSKILRLIEDESYDFVLPRPQDDGCDGNYYFYGVETYYSGSHRPEQYNAMVNLAAAICDAHGWTGKSVLGHKEWTYTKVDPGSVDMVQFRKDVNARIAAVNNHHPAPAPQPAAKPNIKVANLRPGYSNGDVRTYNDLLWKAQGPAYRAAHEAAWMAESAGVFGKMTEQVTYDTYVNAKGGLGQPPTRPCWPGPELIRAIGGNPV